MKQTKLSFDFFRQVYRHVRPFRWRFLGSLGLVAIMQGLSIVSPVVYGQVVDALFTHAALTTTLQWVGLSLIIWLLVPLFDYLRNAYELRHIDFRLDRHIAQTSFAKFLSLSIGQHNNHHSGIKQSIINRGRHALSSITYDLLYRVLPDLLRILFVLVAITWTNLIIGGVVWTGAILFLVVTFYLNKMFQPRVRTLQDMWDKNGKLESELLRNVELIQSNAQESRSLKEMDESYQGIGDYGSKTWLWFERLSQVRYVISVLTRVAVMGLGVWFVYRGMFLPGYIVVLFSWSSDAFGRLSDLGYLHRRLLDTGTSVQKLFQFFEVPSAIVSPESATDISDLRGEVAFGHVSFSYPKRRYLENDDDDDQDTNSEWNGDEMNNKQNKSALHNVSFVIPAGTRTAIVGSSGAGKSTIVHLLLRAYDPDSGHIIIDGIDIRDMNISKYRRSVGMVEQQVALFDNTLRYNICFGRNEYDQALSDDELWHIARMSRVDGFMHKLEKGFDTIIGERGIKLSGGERQRVGIARALAKDPRILIFDEATSNLDTENEHLIQESMRDASKGRTTIVIAHRLSTVQDADQIIVLDEGRVVGVGTHRELLRSCKPYQVLVKHQVVE
ncbi:MAG: ABC transporter ATP-binding protein/permease [Patescibacteria group bacterium]|nr:ABC transporter ATP-binding protein/permease [Patescibacteria group bacterium]